MLNINLQLFAVNTTETLTKEMRTFYDLSLLDYAQPNLVFDQFGQKRPIPKNGGKTINFRAFEPLAKALAPLTEGVTPNGSDLVVSDVTATVAQYGDYVVQSDVLELTSIDNTIVEATKILGRQAGQTLDTITRNKLLEGTNVSFCPKVSGGTETEVTKREDLDATSVLTVKQIQQVVAKLRSVNAPTINGDYVAVIHPFVAYDLMRDPEWTDAHKYAEPSNLYTGEIGKIAGVRFVQTSEAPIIRGGDLASDSYALAVNGAISAGGTLITFDGGTVEADALIGRWIQVGNTFLKVTDNTSTTITVASALPAIADNTPIYPAAGGAGAVFATFVIGDGAYGVTEVTGGGLETIVKQLGYGEDPLNQRSSIGWKALKTAEILMGDYMVRIESCSGKYSASAQEN